MRVILRFLAILFGGIADGLASFDRVMRDYNEFCEGMRTINMRQRVKHLEVCSATNQIAIGALRASLKELACEHKVTEFKPYGLFTNPTYREDCVDCGKVLRYDVTEKERIESELDNSLTTSAELQDKLEALDGDE